MALCQAPKEPVWVVDFSVQGPMVVNADNQGSVALTKNPVFHDRSEHIDIQYHYARDLVKEGRAKLDYVPTDDISLPNPAPCSSRTVVYGCRTFLMSYVGSQRGVCWRHFVPSCALCADLLHVFLVSCAVVSLMRCSRALRNRPTLSVDSQTRFAVPH
jgi:hypothetical protein